MNAADLQRQMLAAKREIDEALREYDRAIREDAKADDEMRRAMSRAFLTTREQFEGKATVPMIQAAVDLETSELQMRARLADGLKKSAQEAVRGKTQWLSALQSMASAMREEARLAKWEPSEVQSA